MKCIRCGSEMSYTMVGITADKKEHPNWYCDKCKSSLAVLKIKMLKKKRLNNVLSKFEFVTAHNHDENYMSINYELDIVYYVSLNIFTFRFTSEELIEIEISLDTVESLIKDLEDNDG